MEAETDVTITAVQCWTAMRRLLRRGPVHGHEHDEQRASRRAPARWTSAAPSRCTHWRLLRHPSALLDWNNNYGDDPDKAVCFHCSNLPKHFFERRPMASGNHGPPYFDTLRNLRRPG